MPGISITDLNNAQLDVTTIAAIANSPASTVTDRLGTIKTTVFGAVQTLKAFNVRGPWVTATPYALKDVYAFGGYAYVAVVAHTSTTVAADLLAGYVTLHQGATREDLAAPGGAALVGRSTRSIYSIAELVGQTGRENGDTAILISYYTGWSVMVGAPLGGSPLTWNATLPRTQHDGGMIFSPTVPFSGNVADINNYLDGVGETAPSVLGCWVRHLPDGIVYVTYYGAVPGGAQDMTRPFNGATQGNKLYSATFTNDSPLKRVIGVPSSTLAFRIEGTVYVRKGQHLRGIGDGPCRIFTPVVSNTGATFSLGRGRVSGVESIDLSGLPPTISNLCTEGGHIGAAVVDMTGTAGIGCYRMFITTAPLGINCDSGDLVVQGCTFDDCTVAGQLAGSRNIVSDNNFFHARAYALIINANNSNQLIRDNTFSFSEINDILIYGAGGTIRGLSIVDNDFIENGQYATKTSHIEFDPITVGATVKIAGNDFYNSKGFGVRGNAQLNTVRVLDNGFSGLPSNSGYTASTTAKGVSLGAGTWVVKGNNFANMFDTPIYVPYLNDAKIIGSTWGNNSYTGPLVTVVPAVGKLLLKDNVGDNVMPLIAASNSAEVRLKNNVQWLGAAQVAGGRKYFKIPTFAALTGVLNITANPNPAGSDAYRKGAVIAISRGTEYISTGVFDYVQSTSLHNYALGFNGPLDVAIELESVGAGVQASPSQIGRSVIVSVPSNYGYFELEISNS